MGMDRNSYREMTKPLLAILLLVPIILTGCTKSDYALCIEKSTSYYLAEDYIETRRRAEAIASLESARLLGE